MGKTRQTDTSRTEYCCVPNCDSDARYDSSIVFHRFPANKDLRLKWIAKIRRDEKKGKFKVTEKSYVCQKHFTPSTYKWSAVRKTLIKGAVPTEFPWKKEEKPRQGKATRREFAYTTAKRSSGEKANITSENPEPMQLDHLESGQVQESTGPVPLHKTAAEELEELTVKFAGMQVELQELRMKLEKVEKFGVNRFSGDDHMINFYTGFPTYASFCAFYDFIAPSAQNMRSVYYVPAEDLSLRGRPRCTLLIDELFMFLCRLRVGLFEEDLAVRFDCSYQTVSRKLITWVNYLYFVLGVINIWLSRETIQKLMPDQFKPEHKDTRVIIDCTEIRCQHPSSLVLNSQLYSSYKSYTTLKSLIGIAPHGALTFLSPLYTGSISDVEITKISGLLDLLESGDVVMADKGFRVGKILEEKNVGLDLPPFLGEDQQFPVQQVHETQAVASLRIHVERYNRRVKEYHFFDAEIPLNYLGSINQMWSVACVLANIKGPLIAEKD